MSAMVALPPPNDSSDSGANTTKRAARWLVKSSRITRAPSSLAGVQYRQANADRREREHHRQHRPPEDADAEHRHRGDGDRRELGRAGGDGTDAAREAQSDDGGGDAVEHRVDTWP